MASGAAKLKNDGGTLRMSDSRSIVFPDGRDFPLSNWLMELAVVSTRSASSRIVHPFASRASVSLAGTKFRALIYGPRSEGREAFGLGIILLVSPEPTSSA